MPHSDEHASDDINTHDQIVDGQGLAVLAESLYVANLLILPLLAFLKWGSLPSWRYRALG